MSLQILTKFCFHLLQVLTKRPKKKTSTQRLIVHMMQTTLMDREIWCVKQNQATHFCGTAYV